MDQKVTMEDDGILQVGDRTDYFLLPRYDLAGYSVLPHGDGFILQNNLCHSESFYYTKHEAELAAEDKTMIAREVYAILTRDALAGDPNACARQAFAADCLWMIKADYRREDRRKQIVASGTSNGGQNGDNGCE